MVDYNEGDSVGPEINTIMVSSAYATVATIMGEDEDGDEVLFPLMETRIFTVDGTEHHLMWPPEAALPLLGVIEKLLITLIGGTHPSHTRIPNTPGDIDWHDIEGDHS